MHETNVSGNTIDLVISEAPASKTVNKNFKFCTLTKSRNQKTINFSLPDEIQAKIVDAYQQGKVVRVFA